jgi:cobalamin biosynthesis protein CobT
VIFVFIQKIQKLDAVIGFVVIRFKADFLAEQKRDLFFDQRFGAVNLKRVIMKREASA